MEEIFGTFRQDIPKTCNEYLEMGFSPTSLTIQQRWRNNGISADFVADYLATFLPAYDVKSTDQTQQIAARDAISYIANELLENAMKFNYEPSEEPIKFSLYLSQQPPVTIVLSVTNGIAPEGMQRLQQFIQEFLSADPEEFYISQVERSLEDESGGSGMGLITIQNDYHGQLGWKFSPSLYQEDTYTLTTMAQITV